MSGQRGGAPDAATVAGLFFKAMHAMMRRSAGNEIVEMHESGRTIPQVIALHVLEKRGPLTVSDVAEAIRLSRAATSHLVERLMRRAMVHREEDAEDRRQKQVSITDEGRALIQRLDQARRGSLASAMSQLQPGTRQKLWDAVQAVLADLALLDGGRDGEHRADEDVQ